MLIPSSKYNIKCPYSMTSEFLVIHNTANDASAANEITYMIKNDNKVSYHIAVDDIEAIQGIPFNRNAWHAGDGVNGKGNRKGIAIEICYSKSGGEKYEKAEENAIEVIVQLLNQYRWGIEKVTKHQDYSGKYCPHRILDNGWDKFVSKIKAKLGSENLPDRGKTNIASKTNLAIDGSWGEKTTRALQKYLGTPEDGVISGQYRNNITEAIYSVEFGTGGSMVIRTLQKLIGAMIDGYIGIETVTKLQRYLGTPVDKKISKPSLMVMELQRRLNKGKL